MTETGHLPRRKARCNLDELFVVDLEKCGRHFSGGVFEIECLVKSEDTLVICRGLFQVAGLESGMGHTRDGEFVCREKTRGQKDA